MRITPQRAALTIWALLASAMTAIAVATVAIGAPFLDPVSDAVVCWYVVYLTWVLADREAEIKRKETAA